MIVWEIFKGELKVGEVSRSRYDSKEYVRDCLVWGPDRYHPSITIREKKEGQKMEESTKAKRRYLCRYMSTDADDLRSFIDGFIQGEYIDNEEAREKIEQAQKLTAKANAILDEIDFK